MAKVMGAERPFLWATIEGEKGRFALAPLSKPGFAHLAEEDHKELKEWDGRSDEEVIDYGANNNGRANAAQTYVYIKPRHPDWAGKKLRVAAWILGVRSPNDRRRVHYRNGNTLDLRRSNLYLTGKAPDAAEST